MPKPVFCTDLETYLNPFMPSGLFYLNCLDRSISNSCDYFLLLPCFIEIPVLNTNSVDPNQTPRSAAASDLGLHCLQRPFHGTLGINRLKSGDNYIFLKDLASNEYPQHTFSW